MPAKLVKCVVCGNDVASDAKECGNCKSEDPTGRKALWRNIRRLVGIMLLLLAGFYIWFDMLPELKQYGFFNNIGQHK